MKTKQGKGDTTSLSEAGYSVKTGLITKFEASNKGNWHSKDNSIHDSWSYLEMDELGFGLTISYVCKLAYSVRKNPDRKMLRKI